MKFCKKRTHSYIGIDNKETTTDYVSFNDVLEFHGKEFHDLWSQYVSSIPKLYINSIPNIYFEDYKFYAYRAFQYLNS